MLSLSTDSIVSVDLAPGRECLGPGVTVDRVWVFVDAAGCDSDPAFPRFRALSVLGIITRKSRITIQIFSNQVSSCLVVVLLISVYVVVRSIGS